jgi:GTP-binding protein YchF
VVPQKVVPAAVEFVDIAGLVKGASEGQGLGNKFLSHIREVDAVCHVVRGFAGGDVIHVEGSVDPQRDRGIIETELALADLDVVRKRIDKTEPAARTGDKDKQTELELLRKIHAVLQEGKLASSLMVTDDERPILKGFQLLTAKPMLYAVNVAEEELATADANALRTTLGLPQGSTVVAISAKIEEDLQDLTADEAAAFLRDLGVTSSGLDRLIHAAYAALGLQTYFTAGVQEVRAWTVPVGATAPQAAGVIHTDFERGFICAEVISYDDYIAGGGEKGAKEKGKMRQEGKTYVMKDGDVVHFRFNV